jgi:hypothetical protein
LATCAKFSCSSAVDYTEHLDFRNSNFELEDHFSEWHYQGSCEEVILNREVKLEFTQYCCEFGFPRVNCAFPAKIESVTTVEESH